MEWHGKSSRPPGFTSDGDDLDPDIRRFVTEMAAAWVRYGGDLASMPPAEARRVAEKVRAPWARGGPRMARITEQVIPGADRSVRVRFYDPDGDRTKPALIYLHGGGWTLFSLDTHDRVMREYAARARLTVIGVDYARSPEAKYPVALEQIVAVARYVTERGTEFGVDPLRIAIGGDSAGANLALAACMCLRDAGHPQFVRAMVLNYGVFNRSISAEAHDRFGGAGNMLTSEEMETFWRNYLRDDRDIEDPLVCPLRGDLHDLPPAFLVVPECDLLAEQSFEMSDRLRAAGVPVEIEIYRGATHSFLESVSISSLADRALTDTATWLRSSFSQP